MVRSVYFAIGAAAFGAAFTLSSGAHADTITLFNNCSYEFSAGCSSNCTPGSINCSVQYAEECSKSCTETPTKTCTTACESECTTNPGSFSCTSYCSDQCQSSCTTTGNLGAKSETDCVTACQAQCSYSCNVTPPSTSCTTECDTTCKASESISCSVKCQEQKSSSCTITPASCTESCNGTGGVIVCNGEVVYVASSITDAGQWYLSHLDAQFDITKFAANVACSGSTCTASASCAATPGKARGDGLPLVVGGIAFVGFGAYRRRRAAR